MRQFSRSFVVSSGFILLLFLLSPCSKAVSCGDKEHDQLKQLCLDCKRMFDNKVIFPIPDNFDKLRAIHHIMMSIDSAPKLWSNKSYFFNAVRVSKNENPANESKKDENQKYSLFLDLMLDWNTEVWLRQNNEKQGQTQPNKAVDELVNQKFREVLSKCSWLMAFWYPEAYLLHRRYPATEEAYQSWFNYLNNEWPEGEAPSIGINHCRMREGHPALLEKNPNLRPEQWVRLKKSVRNRWNTPMGVQVRKHILDCLAGFNQTRWQGPKPNIGSEDLRGFCFDNCNGTASEFKNYDLWNAIFKAGHFERAKFFGTKISDVKFEKTILDEAVFTGGTNLDYGPTYTIFDGVSLKASRWEKCHLLNVIMINCDLQEAQFNNCVFTNVLIINSDLRNSVFNECILNENSKAITCLLSDIQLKNSRIPEKIFTVGTVEARSSSNQISKLVEKIEKNFVDKQGTIAQMKTEHFPVGRLEEAINKALIEKTLSCKLHFLGLHSKINYYNSAEELFLERDGSFSQYEQLFDGIERNRAKWHEKFCDFQSLIVANYKNSGRLNRYRQELTRLECRKKSSSIVESFYKIIDGVVFGFGINSTRFIIWFIGGVTVLGFVKPKESKIKYLIILVIPFLYFINYGLDINGENYLGISIYNVSIFSILLIIMLLVIVLYRHVPRMSEYIKYIFGGWIAYEAVRILAIYYV